MFARLVHNGRQIFDGLLKHAHESVHCIQDIFSFYRNIEVPGGHWDRETDGRSSNDQTASKLVAVGNLLLTRDEENPLVHEKSWETVKGEKKQEGGGRKDRKSSKIVTNDEHAADTNAGDVDIRSNDVPFDDKSNAQRGGRFPKQRRKQFRQAAESMQGVAKGDDTKSADETLDSKQPLTPSVPITARRATERGEGYRDGQGKGMEEPRYQQVNRFIG